MAPFAIAIKACFFYVSSLATSCVDDEVAMFQGQVHLGSLLHKADAVSVVSLEEAMSVSTAMLEDIDDQLRSLKTHLDDLESKPLWIQTTTLKQVMAWVPALEVLDKQVVEYGQSISNLSWDWVESWVESTFSGEGSNADALHKVSKAAHLFNTLSKMVPKSEDDKMAEMRKKMTKNMNKMSSVISMSDTVVNGFDTMVDEEKWKLANATLRTMQWKFVDGKRVFDERMKLWNETMTSMAANTNSSVDVAEFSEAASQLSDDALNMFESAVKPFAQSFDSLPITKEHQAKAAAQNVVDATKQAKKTVADVTEQVNKTVEDVKNTMTVLENLHEGMQHVHNLQKVRGSRKPSAKPIPRRHFR